MKGTLFKSLELLLVAVLIQSCATTQWDGKLDSQLEHESGITQVADLRLHNEMLMNSSSWLSKHQQEGLASLSKRTGARLEALHTETLRLRALLAEIIVSPKFNPQEMAAIQARLDDISLMEHATVSSTIDSANRIIGRDFSLDGGTGASAIGGVSSNL